MKRYKISLLALLGVAVAVMSAFIPERHDSKTVYVWYVNEKASESMDNYQALIHESQLDVVDPANGLPGNPNPDPTQLALIDAYAASHCYSSDIICFGLVRFQDGSAEALQLVKFGNFHD